MAQEETRERLKNIRMTAQYEGTRYNGWQRQDSTENTVQGKLEAVLTRLFGVRVEINGAGRTDAGVHARGQVLNFHISTGLTPWEIMDYVNQYLPEDIKITEACEASERFHSRLNATGKTYVYRIFNSPAPNVLDRRFLWQICEPLDAEAMSKAALSLMGRHDFKAFTSARAKKKSTVREIWEIRVERRGEEIRLTYSGSGFLYHMVRILTGTLVEVGTGARKPEDMEGILASGDRSRAGVLAPAKGLILEEVRYD